MGITMYSHNYSIDLGYYGFFRLRRKIAGLIGEDVGLHYDELSHAHLFSSKEEKDSYWSEYNRITDSLVEKYSDVQKVFTFLYEADCEGSVSHGTCKQILKVLGDYNDDIIYGYAGRPDGAKLKDFKALLRDCVKNKKRLKWS